jgi:uncharacterized protein (DUF2235 family)
MPRNLLILSDGTGLAGGVSPEIADSNVYKICRGTQGPNIDVEKQIVFYDPGVGSVVGEKASLWQRLWARICGASGIGLTDNIIDCYTDIILKWKPGDRVIDESRNSFDRVPWGQRGKWRKVGSNRSGLPAIIRTSAAATRMMNPDSPT